LVFVDEFFFIRIGHEFTFQDNILKGKNVVLCEIYWGELESCKYLLSIVYVSCIMYYWFKKCKFENTKISADYW